LNGFETWSVTLREENKLRVYEIMVLRRIFESGGVKSRMLKSLHTEKLRNLCFSPKVIRMK
jgi:hypothetical protein